MLSNVVDTGHDEAHGNVMPGHAAILGFAEFILFPVLDVLEVHDSVVVEILTGPYLVGNAFRM